uniref:Aryl hydrocarbon receptor n=1 Tax=Sphaeramia orbicularis TaxID=375764 RepID=A0A673A9M0_9TELE
MNLSFGLEVKNPKPPPPDGTKSNPSKRHRDRLNGELDKLTNLLPFTEEVRARLDKLSVLRLSVGYLKVKSFFNATMKKGQNGLSWSSERSLMFGSNVPNAMTSCSTGSAPAVSSSQVTSIDGISFSEGDLLLQALNGFVLVVTAEGYVFYTSPTIQDFLGFHQSDVVHQSVFELIHTDDRALFRRQLHFALNPTNSHNDASEDSPEDQNSADISTKVIAYDPQVIPPENSSFLERNFSCRFRCLLDNSSGFLALNFHGRLKFLHGQNRLSEDGTLVPPQLALFAVATPLQPPSILEIRTKTLLFQTKHKLDFTPTAVDTRGKVVLGYTETELCTRGSGYHFIHAADMMYCADNHLRMMKTGDSGFSVFRLLTKGRTWIWVQANARVVFKQGKPDFIVARQRALTNEEGEEQLRLRRLQLPFSFTTGEAMLYDTAPIVDVTDSCPAPKQRKIDSYSVSPDSLLGCMLRQDQSIYCEHNTANVLNTLNDTAFKDTHATVNVPGDVWQQPGSKSAMGGLVKSECTIQDMMETLQQILGDSNLASTLDVEPEELKSWESALLKMSTSDLTDDLNSILSDDILSFVEEQFQKEGGFKLPDQMDNVPVCLSTLDLQNQNPDGGQDFSWPLDFQNPMMPSREQMVAGQPVLGLGTVKLTHMDLPQLGSSMLNGPALKHSEVGTADTQQGIFRPSMGDSCGLTQNQFRGLQVPVNNNNHAAFSVPQASTNQLFQNQPQVGMPTPLVGLQNQSAEGQSNPGFSFQGNQWNSSVPTANQADAFVQSYNQNISNKAGFAAGPTSASCLPGHFALQTQNSDPHKQSWPLKQQQQKLITNGHQKMGACLDQMSGLQRNPLPGAVAPQNGVNSRFSFRTPETSEVLFPVQQDMELPPMAPSSSCMFRSSSKRTHADAQIPSKPQCFYQSHLGAGSMQGIQTADETLLSCQMTPGLDPNNLLMQQQQPFLNFSEQTQMNSHPGLGNGGFQFPSLPNGNTYYSDNK